MGGRGYKTMNHVSVYVYKIKNVHAACLILALSTCDHMCRRKAFIAGSINIL